MPPTPAPRSERIDSSKIISYSETVVRWYFLAYFYGLIFSCLLTFLEQQYMPYMPKDVVIGILMVVVAKPALFIVFARVVARRRSSRR